MGLSGFVSVLDNSASQKNLSSFVEASSLNSFLVSDVCANAGSSENSFSHLCDTGVQWHLGVGLEVHPVSGADILHDQLGDTGNV